MALGKQEMGTVCASTRWEHAETFKSSLRKSALLGIKLPKTMTNAASEKPFSATQVSPHWRLAIFPAETIAHKSSHEIKEKRMQIHVKITEGSCGAL